MKRVELVNYEELWRDLVILGDERRQRKKNSVPSDQWHGKAKEFDQRVSDRWKQKDSSRSFVNKTLKKFPDATIVDIGAGSGSWVSLMAPQAKKVTAIDPSESMLSELNKRVQREGFNNVEIIKGCWPDVDIEPHDICFCSHSMYGAADFSGFISKMQSVAQKCIILLMRAPMDDGLMARATRLVWGHPYDSPNYQIAINILWRMGIFPNVLMEEDHLWKPWKHPSLELALEEMKSRLGLFENMVYDEELMNLLKKNLRYENGEYIWPGSIRTALLFWDTN